MSEPRTPAAPATHTLADVRAAIDALDDRIVALIAERQGWVERAGELKRGEPTDAVRAPTRVAAVITKVRGLAEQHGASPDVVERTYRAMIAAFIDYELEVQRSR